MSSAASLARHRHAPVMAVMRGFGPTARRRATCGRFPDLIVEFVPPGGQAKPPAICDRTSR